MFKIEISHYLLFLLILVCIYTDLKSRRIYNLVLVPFLIMGLFAAFLTESWPGMIDGLKGFAIGLLILLIPFLKGGLGGGDVKLLAVIGSIMGSSFVINTFVFGALAGGIMAIVQLVLHRRLFSTLKSLFWKTIGKIMGYSSYITQSTETEAKPLFLPYSLAIGSGAATSYLLVTGFLG